jgi:tRNA modification GTPase
MVVMAVNSPTLLLDNILREKLRPENTLVVWNKIDVAPAPVLADSWKGLSTIEVSAVTGSGLEGLRTKIIALADGLTPAVGEDVVAINARHAQALKQARADLAAAAEKLVAGEAAELLASDLRGALAALGEISGKVDNERMLDALFANFCIGK